MRHKRLRRLADRHLALFVLLLVAVSVFWLAYTSTLLTIVDSSFGDITLFQRHKPLLSSDVEERGKITAGATNQRVIHDKEPILAILQEAGIGVISDETLRELPTWTHVTSRYGDRPLIYGLERCKVFQERIHPQDRLVGAAGTFNSGTNLLMRLLKQNCVVSKREKPFYHEDSGVLWSVPWGKHSPVDFRSYHRAVKSDSRIDINNVLSVVTIRDPYEWMKSMCRHDYSIKWKHKKGGERCPNLVPDERDRREFPHIKFNKTINVRVLYGKGNGERHHDSLVHHWNEWYTAYVKASFPRLIVRMEDLVFHPKNVSTEICYCAGGKMRKQFMYFLESAKSAKGHGNRTTLVDVIMRYGKDAERLSGMTPADLELAESTLERGLMDTFNYYYVSPSELNHAEHQSTNSVIHQV